MPLLPHRPYDCTIDLMPGSSLPKGYLSSVSRPQTKTMKSSIDESLFNGIICPSSFLAGAGFFFRALNDITIAEPSLSWLLPSVSYKVPPSSKMWISAIHTTRKTMFNTPSGHYEYLVMPVGLTNTTKVFHALINDVLWEMLNQFFFVYLDDIIFSQKWKDHVQAVLQKLLQNQLFIKAKCNCKCKCKFPVLSIIFLGYIITSGHISMDPEKAKAIMEWLVPEIRKELQRSLGFAKFLPVIHTQLQQRGHSPYHCHLHQSSLPLEFRSPRGV